MSVSVIVNEKELSQERTQLQELSSVHSSEFASITITQVECLILPRL
jgi:hypothetical protein